MNHQQKQETIQKRQEKNKGLLLEQLKKAPIVKLACQKVNVGRATYYRWRKEDKDFAKLADKSLHEGNLLINDMAEAQLLKAIRDNDFKAVVFWLRHHHSKYGNKVEVITYDKEGKLTKEQEAIFDKAMKLADLNPYDGSKDKKGC